MVGSNYQQQYEDQTIATAVGTYLPGGMTLTATKCSQLLAGSLLCQTLGSGFISSPVSASESVASVKVQVWVPVSGSQAANTPLTELGSAVTSMIGKVVRLSYVGV
jgi:hypothetical protein